MKYNHYLKEIGLRMRDVPSYFHDGEKCQRPNKEGFREAEFYNLNIHLACYIYSYLCEGRDIMIENPSFGMTKAKWVEIYDKMIKGFRLYLTVQNPTKSQQKAINFGFRLFVKYFDALWY